MDLQTLADLEAIKQLKARYFRLLDTKQWSEWAEVFTEDARLQWGPADEQIMQGRETIVAQVSANLEDGVSVHHGHMPEIEIHGDTATGIWAMHDYVEMPQLVLRGWGHYHEEYAREAGGWRIRRSRLTRLRLEIEPKGA